MKTVRFVYLAFVMLLACAHLFVTLWLWGPASLISGGSSLKLALFIALFGGWLLAGMADLALSALGMLPLTFAGEAAFANACLAAMAVVNPGYFYLICAALPPVLILVKGTEELLTHDRHFHTI